MIIHTKPTKGLRKLLKKVEYCGDMHICQECGQILCENCQTTFQWYHTRNQREGLICASCAEQIKNEEQQLYSEVIKQ